MYFLNNVIFIAHPRMASRAAAEAIIGAGGSTINGHHRVDDEVIHRIKRHDGAVFCVKRNMFDVLVSWWHNQNHVLGTNKPLNANYKPFADYLDEKAYHTNHKWFRDPVYHYGLKYADVAIPYERLQTGMDSMFRRMWLWPVNLPEIGASKRTDYRDYYTPELRKAVEDRWADDLRLTGYEF